MFGSKWGENREESPEGSGGGLPEGSGGGLPEGSGGGLPEGSGEGSPEGSGGFALSFLLSEGLGLESFDSFSGGFTGTLSGLLSGLVPVVTGLPLPPPPPPQAESRSVITIGGTMNFARARLLPIESLVARRLGVSARLIREAIQ